MFIKKVKSQFLLGFLARIFFIAKSCTNPNNECPIGGHNIFLFSGKAQKDAY